MTSAEIQARINRNAAEQARVLAGQSTAGLAQLQEEQKQLYTLRSAARRAETGRLPAEKVGVGF